MTAQKLGAILVAKGSVTEESLSLALEIQRKSGEPLGEILVREGLADEEQVAEALADQLGIPYVRISSATIDRETLSLIPEESARRLRVLPLFRIENSLSVAMVDPHDVLVIDKLRRVSGLTILPASCSKSGLLEAINRFYRVDSSVKQVLGQFEAERGRDGSRPETVHEAILDAGASEDEAPAVNLLNLLVVQALRDRASDIHIEPDQDCLRVRYRVDGVLREASRSTREIHTVLISRLKILAKLDVAEKRVPQDGSMSVRHEGKLYDLRVSILPTVLGEKAVLRILDKGSVSFGLDRLGLPPAIRATWESLVESPDGIVLVTGPTGSGKTTTLYASLNKINSLEVNIITVEDPVEFGMPLINQVQTNRRAGLDFAAALKSILRQDPDVVMVGEIRDLETAEIAIRAALTGHLVLSTLHTNDTAGTITRLVDMGVHPYLVSAAVRGILAQRLVRRICPKCRVRDENPSPELAPYVAALPSGTVLMKGAGCQECRRSGYAGRVGIYELLVLNDEVRSLVSSGAPVSQVRAQAEASGMVPLFRDGLAKAAQGVTTLEEVVRMTRGADGTGGPGSGRLAEKRLLSETSNAIASASDLAASDDPLPTGDRVV